MTDLREALQVKSSAYHAVFLQDSDGFHYGIDWQSCPAPTCVYDRQALAAEPTESLDAAWAAAEPWGLNERPDLTDDLRWEAHRGITYEYGPTPIAALNALSQALRSEQEKACPVCGLIWSEHAMIACSFRP